MRIDDSDPAFSTAVLNEDLSRRFFQFVSLLQRRNLPLTALVNAFRKYLVTNGEDRCAYLARLDEQLSSMPPHYLNQFNSHVTQLIQEHTIEDGKIRTIERPGTKTLNTQVEKPEPIFDRVDEKAVTTAVFSCVPPAGEIGKGTDCSLKSLLERIREIGSPAQSDGRSPARLVAQMLHLYRPLLDDAASSQDQEAIAYEYAHALTSLWNEELGVSQSFGFLNDLVNRCSDAGHDHASNREARIRGATAGLTGQPGGLVQLLGFIAADLHDCAAGDSPEPIEAQ